MNRQGPIYVKGRLFLGRVEEQEQFRAALKKTLHPPRGETLPYVVLLYGDGGVGKTTLAHRFLDIARSEPPFEGKVYTLYLDWEAERERDTRLRVGREHIDAETVFDTLYTAVQRQGWAKKHFQAYREALKKRKEAERQAEAALSGGEGRDDLAALRSAGAAAVAKLLRVNLPIGEGGEKLAQAFLEAGIRVGAEQAAALRGKLEARLRARLGVELYDLYVNPHERLARALADGFERLSHRRAVLVVLDTYEIVDRADPWLRLVLQAAGPRLLWLLGGRDNLRDSRPYGKGYFHGYAEDWPRRLLAYDLGQLALRDVRTYFDATVPRRPLSQEAARAIAQATRGVPLAVVIAAEMWAKGKALEAIVGQEDAPAPGGEIARRMVERYLLHAVESEDRRALYALALARGDLDLLCALLAPEGDAPFDLEAELRRLERDYASVMISEGRLHDVAQDFFARHLRAPLQRRSPAVLDLLARAEAALRARLASIEADYPLIEERYTDEDWRNAALRLTDILFWQDERKGWRWLLPRFVESLAYSRPMRRALLEEARKWRETLSARGRRRLEALEGAEKWFIFSEGKEEEALLAELGRALARGDLGGPGEAERRAILAWQRGDWLRRQGRHEEALAAYGEAERGLPPGGEVLRERLAESLDDLAGELMWPGGRRFSVYHPDAVRILRKVTAWLPENGGAWYKLGVALADAGQKEEAISAYQRAIDIEPRATRYNGLGIVYADLGRQEEAIEVCRKAIALDSRYASPWIGLGIVYRKLGRYEEAIEAYRKAIELDPQLAYPWNNLGLVYAALGRYEEAIEAYRKAIALDSRYASPWLGLGNVYYQQGRQEEAIEAYRKAIDLDPQYTAPWHNLGNVYRALGRYEEAIEAYRKAIALDPQDAAPWLGLGLVYALREDWAQAEGAFRKAVELAPDEGVYRSSLVGALRHLGREAEAREEAARARPLMAQESEYDRACFEAICGRKEEALRLLEIALQKRQVSLLWARQDPDLRSLHDDPRFRELVG